MWEWREQRLEVAGAADRRTRKDLHVVRAGAPGSDGLSGCERARARDFLVGLGHIDDVGVKAGTDDELRSGFDGGLGLSACDHGAGAQKKFGSVGFLEFLEQIDGAG